MRSRSVLSAALLSRRKRGLSEGLHTCVVDCLAPQLKLQGLLFSLPAPGPSTSFLSLFLLFSAIHSILSVDPLLSPPPHTPLVFAGLHTRTCTLAHTRTHSILLPVLTAHISLLSLSSPPSLAPFPLHLLTPPPHPTQPPSF